MEGTKGHQGRVVYHSSNHQEEEFFLSFLATWWNRLLPFPSLSLPPPLSLLSRQKYAKPLARCQSKRLAFRTLNWTKPQPSLARARHSVSVAICRKKIWITSHRKQGGAYEWRTVREAKGRKNYQRGHTAKFCTREHKTRSKITALHDLTLSCQIESKFHPFASKFQSQNLAEISRLLRKREAEMWWKCLLKPQGSIVSYEESPDEGEHDTDGGSKGLKGVPPHLPSCTLHAYLPPRVCSKVGSPLRSSICTVGSHVVWY